MIGLQSAQNVVKKLLAKPNGVQAILLYGPQGAGKSLIVDDLIENWVGTERAVDAYRRGTNADILFVRPEGASRLIAVDKIRTGEGKSDAIPVTEFVRTPPLYSRAKIVVIEDFDRLTHGSDNSLLKPLEEPHSYTRFILTTTKISAIRSTILSRCLVVACELPSAEELRQSFPDSDPDLVGLSEGAPGLLSQIDRNPDLYRKILSFSDRLATGRPADALVLSDQLRSISEEVDDAEKLGARTSNARVIELLAVAFIRRHPSRSDVTQKLTEAHRRIVGNAAANLVFDATISNILVGG